MSPDLEALLAEARIADQLQRIEFRDPIAAFGEGAIEPMADWIGDPRLAAFAIRTLERIGADPTQREAVLDVLEGVSVEEFPAHLVGDVQAAIARLRPVARPQARRSRVAGRRHLPGEVGERGIRYWALRTSPWERPFVWSELLDGRLRQGWGAYPEQDLRLIADAREAGKPISPLQELAWPSRRMLETEHDGMRVGDVIVTQNLPATGRFSIVRVTGPYRYELTTPHQWEERFGHILPVQLLEQDIERGSASVSEPLRRAISLPGRLYNITKYGGDVEKLIGR